MTEEHHAGSGLVSGSPSRDDPLVSDLSSVAGGPLGSHASTGRSWWTPLAVMLLVTTAVCTLGMIQKTPCQAEDWPRASLTPYTHLCYSDIAYLYAERGLFAGQVPYLDEAPQAVDPAQPTQTQPAYPPLEYPVLTGAFAYVSTLVTHGLAGPPEVSGFDEDARSSEATLQTSGVFFAVSAVGLFVCALVAVATLARTHRGRPWDAMVLAAAPSLALAGLINWDLLAVALLCGALLAWSRSRPVVTGILIGLGTAAKLYPLFLLGALLVVCLRARRLTDWSIAAAAAAGAWLLVNAPVYVLAPDAWLYFWTFNADRGGEFGSFWYVLTQAGVEISAVTVNRVSLLAFIVACAVIAAFGLLAPRRPRVPQLALLIVAAFLIVNKVYSPQYVLWLLPLVALARPRWRDVAIWQACEVFYWAMIWLHLGGALDPGGDAPDRIYWVAVAVRIAGTLWICGVVVRDILVPRSDPVRANGLTDDPAGGVVDGVEDRGRWWSRAPEPKPAHRVPG